MLTVPIGPTQGDFVAGPEPCVDDGWGSVTNDRSIRTATNSCPLNYLAHIELSPHRPMGRDSFVGECPIYSSATGVVFLAPGVMTILL